MKIEVSNGEIIDKYTILKIKLSKINDPEKRLNIRRELKLLKECADLIYANLPKKDFKIVANLGIALQEINEKLWKVEDEIRECEKAQYFDEDFIALARDVPKLNDQRAKLKYEINAITGSLLVEEKSYA